MNITGERIGLQMSRICSRCKMVTICNITAAGGRITVQNDDGKEGEFTGDVEITVRDYDLFVTFCTNCGQIQGKWPAKFEEYRTRDDEDERDEPRESDD